jgi:hypothetical protein
MKRLHRGTSDPYQCHKESFFILSPFRKDRDRQLVDIHYRLHLNCGQIKITRFDFCVVMCKLT